MASTSAENSNMDNEDRSGGNEPGGFRNSLPLVLSGIAVLIAALALIANQMAQPAPRIDPFDAVNNKLGQIEARIGDMESQLTIDKLDGASMQLKRILLDLEQLSQIADETTRSSIDQAYQLLKPLSDPASSVKAEVDVQSTMEPENQSAPEGPAATNEPATADESSATDIAPLPEATTPSPVEEPANPAEPVEHEPGSMERMPADDMNTDASPQTEPERIPSAAPQEPVTHL